MKRTLFLVFLPFFLLAQLSIYPTLLPDGLVSCHNQSVCFSMISALDGFHVVVFPQEVFGDDAFGYGVYQLGELSLTMSSMGFDFSAISSSSDIASVLPNCDIFIVWGYVERTFSSEELDSLRSFLRRGGCVILVATAPPSDISELGLLNPVMSIVGMEFVPPRLSFIDTLDVVFSYPFLLGISQVTTYKPLPISCSPQQRVITAPSGECILAIDSSLGGFLVASGEDMWFLNGPYIFGGVPCGFNALQNGHMIVNILRYVVRKSFRFCGIDTDFCEVSISGSTFHLSDESLEWDGFNLCFNPPDGFWTDGNYDVEVFARDTCGASLSADYTIHFDLSPPVMTLIEPLNDTLVGAGDTAYFHIVDYISGVDVSHSYFVLDDVDTFPLSVRRLDGNRYWLWPWGGWTIGEHRICIHSQDLSVLCQPNFIDTCFTFVLTEDTLRTYFRDIYVEGCSLVYTEVCVTGGGRFVRDLYLPDFYFYENDSFLVPPWIEQLSTCPGDSLPVDIVFLFDYSTSMDSEVVAFFDAIPSLVSALGVSNYRIACVVFNGCPEEYNGIWKVIQTNFSSSPCVYNVSAPDTWAVNLAEFQCLYQAVRGVYSVSPWGTRGSGYEDQYGAIYRAYRNLHFRDDALKVFILFTDERPIVTFPPCSPNWNETAAGLDSIIAFCQRNDIVVFPVTPHDGEFAYTIGESPDRRFYDGYYTLGPATGGVWFYLYSSDYDSLAYYIGAAIMNIPCCYRFRYWERQFCNDWNNLRVNVDANDVFYGQDDTIYVPPCPPQPRFVFPEPPGGITTCRSQGANVQFECEGPCAIDWPTTIIIAGSHGFSFGTGLIWSEPVLELHPDIIGVCWADGETVRVYLAQCYDTAGCPIPVESTWFVADTMPPYFFDLFPPPDTVLYIPDPLVRVGIADDVAGVRWEEVTPSNFSIYVNGALISGYGVMGNPPESPYYVLTHPPFADGDYVTVCVDNIPDNPTYNYCPPNLGDTCWSFRVSISGPIAQMVTPAPNSISACVDQEIVIAITDSNGVDSMTILLVINDDTFTVEHPWVKFWNDTLYFEPDSGYWRDGQLVTVSIIRADDMLGAPLQNPLEWQFRLDFSPPTANMELPIPESAYYDYSPVIQVELDDNLSGVMPDSFIVHIRYTNGMIDTVFSWQNAMLWSSPNLFISCPQLNVMFPPGDTVYIELRACDSPTPGYCNPNCTDYLWRFYYPFPWGCQRLPNPFTPNADGKNDVVQFTFPNMGEKQGDIFIYDVRNVLMRHIVVPPEGSFAKALARWNGLDENGRNLPEGLYLYVILVDGRVVCEGTVTIAR